MKENFNGQSIVLAAAGVDNVIAIDDNIIIIIFIIKDTKLYVLVVTLSAKHNHKLSKLLSKRFERSVYWNEDKTRSKNKNMRNKYRYFIESKFVGVNILLAWFIQIKITIQKDIKP